MRSHTYLVVLIFFFISCNESEENTNQTNENPSVTVENPFVDPESPSSAKPLINIGLKKYSLVFSDEFNDSKIDESKWNVQNKFIRDRGAFDLYASEADVEEKQGLLFIHYRKDKSVNNKYYAGRVESKGKYATTYGFLEARMHFVKPYGHQTAFWMMPEGNGMEDPWGVDGSANDGAEIDIIEANKLKSFSCGLHWDAYGKNRKSNGKNISAENMHNVEFHTVGFEWSEEYLRWYFNGEMVREITDQNLIPRVPHFIYFSGSMWDQTNWVVGSALDNELIQGDGDAAYIDYIRVYKK